MNSVNSILIHLTSFFWEIEWFTETKDISVCVMIDRLLIWAALFIPISLSISQLFLFFSNFKQQRTSNSWKYCVRLDLVRSCSIGLRLHDLRDCLRAVLHEELHVRRVSCVCQVTARALGRASSVSAALTRQWSEVPRRSQEDWVNERKLLKILTAGTTQIGSLLTNVTRSASALFLCGLCGVHLIGSFI
jgi:hypothetical protein